MSFLSTIVPTVKGALVLDDATFEAMRDAPDGMARGLRFLVTLALAVGLVLALVSFFQGAMSSPSEQLADSAAQMDGIFETMESFGVFGNDPEADEMVAMILENVKAGLSFGAEIATSVEESTPAPQIFVTLFEAIGAMLSLPFSWIALWLTWGVLTLLFARLMGGTATIQQMLATTSLVAAPHLLDALGFLPCLGGILGFLALLWAIAVYVKGTMVANRITAGKALLAVFLPAIIPLALVFGAIVLVIVFANLGG